MVRGRRDGLMGLECWGLVGLEEGMRGWNSFFFGVGGVFGFGFWGLMDSGYCPIVGTRCGSVGGSQHDAITRLAGDESIACQAHCDLCACLRNVVCVN